VRAGKTRRRAAFRSASTLVMAGFAGAAFADSIPPLNPGPAASLSNPSAQSPAGAGVVPADPSSALNPAPFALPQLAALQFRADASAPSKPASAGPWGVLSGDWQNSNLLGDMGGLRPAWPSTESRRRKWAHHRDGAVGHPESVRSERGHVQRQRPPYLGRLSQPKQPAQPANCDRYRGLPFHPTLGALVSAEIWRQVRRQDWRAEPRPGIHYQSKFGVFPQFDDGGGRCCPRRVCPPAAPTIRSRSWASAEECK
jgi:hypothetical protein